MLKRLAVLAVVPMAGCSWRGTPKVPAESEYSKCVAACPSRICAPEGKGWLCLPEPTKDGRK